MLRVTSGSFHITAIGAIDAHYPEVARRRLSPASRHLLAVLIAAGPRGLSASELAWERDPTTPPSEQAVRMATARLRKHLNDEVFPRADDGRYRLAAPTKHVDVWVLEEQASRSSSNIDPAQLAPLLVKDPAFSDVPSSELLDRAARRVRDHQRELLIRLAIAHPDALTGDVLGAIVRQGDENPLDERLVYHGALALSRFGSRSRALKHIGRSRLAFREAGLDLSDAVVDLEQRLLDGGTADLDVQSQRPAVALNNPLKGQITGVYVGDRTDLERMQSLFDDHTEGLTTVLVSGVSGSGKTRICAEAVQHAIDAGWPAISIVPSTLSDQTPFAPLAAALPELGTQVAAVMASDADADSARLQCWQHARLAIDARRINDLLVIAVDDTQWLDDSTAEFLAHLVTSTVEGPTVVLLNGRNDVTQSARWVQLRNRIETTSSTTIELKPLSSDAIRDLIDDLRPRLSGSLLSTLSREVFEHSSGLPGVARLLLAAIPEGSAVLPRTGAADRNAPLSPVFTSLSDTALRVGLAAAVVGPRFGFDATRAASGLDDSTIFTGLDELVDRGLIVDVSLSEFELAHTLVERGLISAAAREETADTHRRAAEYHAADTHRRAHHLARALPTVDAADAVRALRESAELAMSERSHRLAIRQYEDVQNLSADVLAPDELGNFSRALDLCGMHDVAQIHRHNGFERAAAARDWSSALSIATSGLPEVEPLDGDPTIAAQLRRVDAGSLPQHEAWRHACHAARQLAISGDVDGAGNFAQRAVELASTSDERVGAALVRRFCVSTFGSPAEGIAVMESVHSDIGLVGESLQADYQFNLALEHHRNGDIAAARSDLDQLESLPGRSAVKSWHAMMMRSTLEFDTGNLSIARDLRTSAHQHAVSAGLGEADNALLASTFVDLWLSGTSALLVDEVDGGVLDPSHRHLTNAAAAAVLFEAGHFERAAQLAAVAVATAQEVEAPQTIAILAVVSAPLAMTADDATLSWVRKRFAAAGNSMLIIGASAANMGPVTRFHARIAPDATSRRALLHEAFELAERSGSRLWQAIVLSDLVGDGDLHRQHEFADLVDGTELASMLQATGASVD